MKVCEVMPENPLGTVKYTVRMTEHLQQYTPLAVLKIGTKVETPTSECTAAVARVNFSDDDRKFRQ